MSATDRKCVSSPQLISKRAAVMRIDHDCRKFTARERPAMNAKREAAAKNRIDMSWARSQQKRRFFPFSTLYRSTHSHEAPCRRAAFRRQDTTAHGPLYKFSAFE